MTLDPPHHLRLRTYGVGEGLVSGQLRHPFPPTNILQRACPLLATPCRSVRLQGSQRNKDRWRMQVRPQTLVHVSARKLLHFINRRLKTVSVVKVGDPARSRFTYGRRLTPEWSRGREADHSQTFLGLAWIVRFFVIHDKPHTRIPCPSDHQSTQVQTTAAIGAAADSRIVDQYPDGYGKVAAFIDCDPNFRVFRKFGWLHIRVLLRLQDEMQLLEEQLEDLDKWEAESGQSSKLVSRRSDSAGPRAELLDEIKKKLAEYGKHRAGRSCSLQCHADLLPDGVFLSLHQIQAIKKPTKRNQNSIYNEIEETQSIVSSEAKWIRQKDDLAALGVGAEHGWFNGFVEDTLNKCSKGLLFGIFRTPRQQIRTGSEPGVSLISPNRIDILLRVILTIVAVVLLLAPVIILVDLQPRRASQVNSRNKLQIMVIFLFTLAFSFSSSIFTKARKQEVFVATAAYCAVLVVFLGNTSSVIVIPNQQ